MRTLIAVFASTMLLATGAMAQDDCSLNEVASLPLTMLPDGGIAVPVKVNGRSLLLAVEIQAPHSSLDAAHGGGDSHSIVMGSITFSDENIGATADAPAGSAGIIGMDILRRFEMELDMHNAKLHLFAHPDCPGAGVVYWTSQYTFVPMHIDGAGHVIAQVTLDGRPANVEISTAPGHLAVRAPAAVKALGFGAISLDNPPVVMSNEIAPGADARMGLDELRNLHLFFAFGDGKLYATP